MSRSSPSALSVVNDSVVAVPSFISDAWERSPSGNVSLPNRNLSIALTAVEDMADNAGIGCTNMVVSKKRTPQAAQRPPSPTTTWDSRTVEPRSSYARHWTNQPATPNAIATAESPSCSTMDSTPQTTTIKSVGHETLRLTKSQLHEPANRPPSRENVIDSHSKPAPATSGRYKPNIELR